jgi:hypothetical protein
MSFIQLLFLASTLSKIKKKLAVWKEIYNLWSLLRLVLFYQIKSNQIEGRYTHESSYYRWRRVYRIAFG